MTTKTIRGALETGLGCAKDWSIGEIRKVTGCPSLQPGTMNGRLDAPHKIRIDALLLREGRIYNLDEDLVFERCQLLLGGVSIPAWMVRTSRDLHGGQMLEIMAARRLRQRYGSNE